MGRLPPGEGFFAARFLAAAFLGSRHEDQWDTAPRSVGSERNAGHARHQGIQHDYVGSVAIENGQRLVAGRRRAHAAIGEALQGRLQNRADARIIVDDEHVRHALLLSAHATPLNLRRFS